MQEGGNMYTCTLNNTEWGGGGGREHNKQNKMTHVFHARLSLPHLPFLCSNKDQISSICLPRDVITIVVITNLWIVGTNCLAHFFTRIVVGLFLNTVNVMDSSASMNVLFLPFSCSTVTKSGSSESFATMISTFIYGSLKRLMRYDTATPVATPVANPPAIKSAVLLDSLNPSAKSAILEDDIATSTVNFLTSSAIKDESSFLVQLSTNWPCHSPKYFGETHSRGGEILWVDKRTIYYINTVQIAAQITTKRWTVTVQNVFTKWYSLALLISSSLMCYYFSSQLHSMAYRWSNSRGGGVNDAMEVTCLTKWIFKASK